MPVSGSPRGRFRSGAPYLFPIAVTALVVAALWAGRDRLASLGASLESPDTEIRRAQAAQGRARLDDVYGFRAGGVLELSQVRYREVVTTVEGDRATAVAVLDAEGRVAWRDQSAEVSYLGRERFHLRRCRAAIWCAEGDQFERLRGVLRVLFRRADAFAAGDAAACGALVAEGYRDGGLDRAALLERLAGDFRGGPPGRLRILGWQVRVERDGAEAGEDYELEAPGAAPRRLRARYRLVEEQGSWRIAGGL